MPRTCAVCDAPLPERSRIDRLTCSAACRQRAYEARKRLVAVEAYRARWQAIRDVVRTPVRAA